ncbi:MAG: hypothetical protein WCI92_00630 [Bacteroidota bacterium]
MNRIQIMANPTSGQAANNPVVNTKHLTDENRISERIKKLKHERFLTAKEIQRKNNFGVTALIAKRTEIERELTELDPNWLTGKELKVVVDAVKVVAPKQDRTLDIIENSRLNPEDELSECDRTTKSPTPDKVTTALGGVIAVPDELIVAPALTMYNEPDEETTEDADVISPPTAPITPAVNSEVSLSDENSAPEKNIMDDGVLTILPELENFLPPLSPKQFSALEKRLRDEGCRNAIVVWNHIIIDGHNRYKICKARNIEFNIIEKEFPNIDAVKVWMIDNQKEQRQLSPFQTIVLSIMRAKILEPTAKANQLAGLKQNSTAFQNSEKRIEPINLTKIAAELADVSNDTASRVKKILKCGSVEDRELIYKGQKSINEVYTVIKQEEKLRKLTTAKTGTPSKNKSQPPYHIDATKKYQLLYIHPNLTPSSITSDENMKTIRDLRSLNVIEFAEDDAVLFLHIPHEYEQQAEKLVTEWGFKYVEHITAVRKQSLYTSKYFEQVDDMVLVCNRNKGIPVGAATTKRTNVMEDDQVVNAIDEIFDIRLSRVGIFTEQRNGWDCYNLDPKAKKMMLMEQK